MDRADLFSPYQALATAVLADLAPANPASANFASGSSDGAHDRAHLLRVWRNAFEIAEHEGGDGELIAAAVLLHDCVPVEKNSPDRARASQLAADQAHLVLDRNGWAPDRVSAVAHAIAAHSFSAAIAPETLEARILQDADRLDAIGMIGVARCFYTAGRMGSLLYDPNDPRAEHRELDDSAFALDHFHAKLLKLHQGFQTDTGRSMAAERARRLAEFLTLFEIEIGAFSGEVG